MKARAHVGMPEGWRDVPMPKSVAQLPRTKGGIPITYTVAWSSETGAVIRHDPIVGADAIFANGRQGEGSPKLAITDTSRQRRVAVEGLCQVCGQRLPGSRKPPWRQHPRWVADLRKNGQTIKLGWRTVPLIIDGWTCEPCLAYALRVCPGLLRKDWTPDAPGALRLLRVYDAQLIATMERPDSLPDVAIGFVKVAPTSYDVVHPETFARVIESGGYT